MPRFGNDVPGRDVEDDSFNGDDMVSVRDRTDGEMGINDVISVCEQYTWYIVGLAVPCCITVLFC